MKYFFLVVASAFSLNACSASPSGGSSENLAWRDTTGKPVETKQPNTKYTSAFKGQTRIAGVTTKTPYQWKILTSGLSRPWGIAGLPGGKFIITEKSGTMRIVTADGAMSAAITGIPEVDDQGQGGLLSITPDPDFTNNRMLYWTFSKPVSGKNLTAVAKGKLSADEKRIENAVVIYQATPAYNGSLHFGGRILFDKDGNLFVSTGERSDKQTRPQAQLLNSALGKVLRITTDGKPATGNPFLSDAAARPEIYTYGHRNVQSLAIHPVTGDLWEAEFGPRGGDELNLIKPGKNYGWATITYGIEYSGEAVGKGMTQQEGLEQPVYYWDPVISPSGMTFYSKGDMPEWNNNLFIGSLSGQHILRLIIENNKVTGEERLLEGEGQRFRAVVQGGDGMLYAITDSGRLYRVSKK